MTKHQNNAEHILSYQPNWSWNKYGLCAWGLLFYLEVSASPNVPLPNVATHLGKLSLTLCNLYINNIPSLAYHFKYCNDTIVFEKERLLSLDSLALRKLEVHKTCQSTPNGRINAELFSATLLASSSVTHKQPPVILHRSFKKRKEQQIRTILAALRRQNTESQKEHGSSNAHRPVFRGRDRHTPRDNYQSAEIAWRPVHATIASHANGAFCVTVNLRRLSIFVEKPLWPSWEMTDHLTSNAAWKR